MKVHPLQKPDLIDIHAITKKLKAEKEKEHLYLIKNGKAFAWFEGDKYSVTPPIEQTIRFRDALVLHNHPDGTSFSFEDVDNAIQTNIKEMRLITFHNTFILKRPNNGWNINFQDEIVEKNYTRILLELEDMLDTLYSKGKITGKEKENAINHLLWLDFFPIFDIEYFKF